MGSELLVGILQGNHHSLGVAGLTFGPMVGFLAADPSHTFRLRAKIKLPGYGPQVSIDQGSILGLRYS